MQRSTGLAIGAVVLSVTLGVMIGLVIHASTTQQATEPPPAPSTPGGAVSDRTTTSAGDALSPRSRRHTTAGSPSWHGAVSDARTAAETGTDGRSSAVLTTEPAIGPVAGNGGDPHSSPAGSSPPDTAPPTGHAGNSSPAASDKAGASCGELAARSVDPAGTTLFCQHNQDSGKLQWRAVVDGGGCLNQSMTGTGADGHDYVCRLDDSGLNHWARAG